MRCPVCLSPSTAPALTGTDILFETTSRVFKLDSCAACHCLFLNPAPGTDEIAGYYPENYWWNTSRPSLLKVFERIYRRLALHDHIAFITASASRMGNGQIRILDVGCGSATLLGILKTRGFDVVGVDTSSEASRVARETYGVQVIVGSLDQAGLAEESLDIVTLFHVMEHVTNPRDVLADVRRLLKTSGSMILQVPNIDSWQFRWFGARWYGLDIPRHVIDYSLRAIVGLVEGAGFKVIRSRQFNLRDNAPALISSLFPALDPISRPIRLRRRNRREPAIVSWCKHLVYFVLVLCAYPVTMLEAAFGHGATVMIEARKQQASGNVESR